MFPGDLPDAMSASLDLDVMPLDGSDRSVHELAWMTDGGLFAESNDGAHADPVAEGVATLASGWRARLICFETPNMITPRGLQARAWVLEPHDLLASKVIAGRAKDFEFRKAVIGTGIIERDVLRLRLETIRTERADKARSADIGLVTVRAMFEATG